MPPNPSYAHPSVQKLKVLPPNLEISKYGLLEFDKPVKFVIKNNESPNGSVASKDVAVNGTYALKSSQGLNRTGSPNNKYPTIDQAGPYCQILPLFHMIQSQLNFPIDYESLFSCLDDSFIYSAGPSQFGPGEESLGYVKLHNMLFGKKCFSVKNNICFDQNEVSKVGRSTDKSDCDNPCHVKIKITALKEPPIKTEKDLCDRIKSLGPKGIGSYGLTTMKLELLSQKRDWTWDMVKTMPFDILNIHLKEPYTTTIGLGHFLTIVGCSNGKFEIKNSWGKDNESISISYQDITEHFNLGDGLVDSLINRSLGLYLNYFPLVEICSTPSVSDLQKCKEDLCKEKGYDGAKPSSVERECECYCDPSASAHSSCNNKGQSVQKVFSINHKKCICPEHPDLDKFYYVAEGDSCCERSWRGSWCEKKYCPQTKLYYTTGMEKRGYAEEYQQLEAAQLATDWERISDPFDNNEPRTNPCLADDIPPICSGFSSNISSSAQSLFNIASVTNIGLV
jgi:hypothetical protein